MLALNFCNLRFCEFPQFCKNFTYSTSQYRFYCLISVLTRDQPDNQFWFQLGGYPGIFSNPVLAKIVPGTGYLSRMLLGAFWQLVHQANSRRSHYWTSCTSAPW